MTVCPLCGSHNSRVICDCRDVPIRLNTLAGMIHQCTNCQFLYKEPNHYALDALEKIYTYTVKETQTYFGPTLKGYDLDSAEIRLYSFILNGIRQRLGPAERNRQRLLDVGCGTGALLDRSRAFGFTPYGLELNPHFAKYAREAFGLPVVAGKLSVEYFEPASFDVVTMIDLVEHVPNPLELLNIAWQLLRPSGVLVVYTPNHRSLIAQMSLTLYRLTNKRICKPAYAVFGTNHICFFDHQTLPMALQKARYTVDTVCRMQYDPAHKGEVDQHSLLAIGLLGLEKLAQLLRVPYRLLAFAYKQAETFRE